MRAQLLAALHARFETVVKTGDGADLRTDEARGDAESLHVHLVFADGTDVDAQVAYAIGMFHWLRAVTADSHPVDDADQQQDQVMASALLLPLYLTQPDGLPEPVRVSFTTLFGGTEPEGDQRTLAYAAAISDLAMVIFRCRVAADDSHGDAVMINLLNSAANSLPVGDERRPVVLCNLAYAVMVADIQPRLDAYDAPAADEDTALPADLDSVVAIFREAFQATPDGHPNYSRCAYGLALSLRIKAELTNSEPILAESIELFRTAVRTAETTDPTVAQMLVDLAAAVLPRPSSGPPSDHEAACAAVDEAVDALERAARMVDEGAPEPEQLSALARQAYLARATLRARRPTDPAAKRRKEILDASTNQFLAGMDGSGAGPDSPMAAVMKVLGADAPTGTSRWSDTVELMQALLRYPDEVDLETFEDKALQILLRQYQHMDPADVRTRLLSPPEEEQPSHRTPDPAALAEVTEVIERMRREVPDDHEHRPLIDLTHSQMLMVRARSTALEPSEEAMNSMTEALANAMEVMSTLNDRFDITGEQFEAVATLGHALLSPFETLAVIDRAIAGYRERLGAGSPADQATRTYLAHALFQRFALTHEEAVFREAADLARENLDADGPPDPLLAATWARAVTNQYYLGSMTDAPDAGTTRPVGLAELSAHNAADEIRRLDARGALETLESGRAIMLSSAFDTRRELDALRVADAGLAERFGTLREQIVDGMNPGMEPRPGGPERFRGLAREWRELTGRIAALPGFDRFLMPLPLGANDLVHAAVDGPVVSVNVDRRRCDALTLTSSGVGLVPLPDLNEADLAGQAEAFLAAIETLTVPGAHRAPAVAEARQVVADTLDWLWHVLAEPVLLALGLTGPPPVGQPWPRVWWSPTGPLNLLPVHAAGRAGGGPSVLDRAVSSYTPTVRALMHSRSQPAPRDRTMLAVAMPQTPGHRDLQATVHEINTAVGGLPGPGRLIGPDATRDGVLAALPQVTLAHFACHASSDPLATSASHLMLHDGPLPVSDISRLRLESAELAYLSACATSRGNMALANEAIHIAAAFQVAGYSQAVGTLWEVDDRVAARVAEHFHRELAGFLHGPGRLPAAVALHRAVRQMRAEQPDRPWTWAGYVHAGA
jgi:hypothetical protein